MRQIIRLIMVSGLVLAGGCAVSNEKAASVCGQGRERLSMDFGWKFHLGHPYDSEKDFGYQDDGSKAGGADGPMDPNFKADDWQTVDLPHDWVVALEMDKDAEVTHAFKKIGFKYPENSVGWYRKVFEIPESDSGKRLTLEFDGVFRNCEVWLNGYTLRRHLSGYTSFAIDITDYAKYGQKNILAVRADARGHELWSHEGAGIYRHVWLLKTAPMHVAQWGTYVRADVKLKDKPSAEITMETAIANEGDCDKQCELQSIITDAEGKTVASVESKKAVNGWDCEKILQKVKLKNVNLWSVDSPYLYKLLTVVKKQGKTIDTYETPFGIRTIRFDADEGFFLNGKHLMLKGVCLHQDHGGVGVAIPDVLHDFRISKMKELGANAFRCAHNPVSPEALNAADRLGMLVIDETRAPGSTKERLEQLSSMVRRDRNHPSVILWSMCNEEGEIEKSETGLRIIRSMKRQVRKLDPTRPVTLAMTQRYIDTPFVTEALDVQGFNYIKPKYDEFHRKFADKPFVLTESCCHSTARGIYESNEPAGRFTGYDENPACWGETAEKMLKWCAERPWVAGTFVWTGFDYAGEPLSFADDCRHLSSEEIWPIVHTQWGIVDRCGLEKDPYYYFKSWWTNEPVLHVFPHWNWVGKEGQEIRVWCYSNCDEVELLVNGNVVGKQKMERNSHLEWKVKYEPGYIEVKGYKGGKVVATDRQETTGEAKAIMLKPDRATIKADSRDISQVIVKIADEKGRLVQTANNEITFTISDNGKIIGVCNGDPACHLPENLTTYPVFSGQLMVYVQSGRQAGTITLKAESQGLEKGEVTIEAQQCEVEPFVAE